MSQSSVKHITARDLRHSNPHGRQGTPAIKRWTRRLLRRAGDAELDVDEQEPWHPPVRLNRPLTLLAARGRFCYGDDAYAFGPTTRLIVRATIAHMLATS